MGGPKPKRTTAKKQAKGQEKSKEQCQLDAKALTCTTCQQSSNGNEKMLNGKSKQLIRWLKGNVSRVIGLWVPSGNECYYCRDTRIRFFGLDESQESLNKAKEKDAEFEKKWAAYRSSRVNGTNEFTHLEKCSIADIVKTSKANFYKGFEEGGFYALKRFCKLHCISCKGGDEAMKARVKEKFPKLEVDSDARDVLGVFYKNDDPNISRADYKYQRGFEHAKQLVSNEKHESRDAAEAAFDGSSDDPESEAQSEDEQPEQQHQHRHSSSSTVAGSDVQSQCSSSTLTMNMKRRADDAASQASLGKHSRSSKALKTTHGGKMSSTADLDSDDSDEGCDEDLDQTVDADDAAADSGGDDSDDPEATAHRGKDSRWMSIYFFV